MSQKINFTLSIQVDGGPSFTNQGHLPVNSYEMVTVPIKAAELKKNENQEIVTDENGKPKVEKSTTMEYKLPPKPIWVIAIAPKKPSQKLSLSWKFANTKDFKATLNNPLFFPEKNLSKEFFNGGENLTFKNESPEEAIIQVLIGRTS